MEKKIYVEKNSTLSIFEINKCRKLRTDKNKDYYKYL